MTVSTEYPSKRAVAPIRRSANGITTPRLCCIQLAGQPCNIRGHGIDHDGRKELFNEGSAASPAFGRISTVDSVNEFNNADRR